MSKGRVGIFHLDDNVGAITIENIVETSNEWEIETGARGQVIRCRLYYELAVGTSVCVCKHSTISFTHHSNQYLTVSYNAARYRRTARTALTRSGSKTS